jgi:phosphatidylglycerophosphate synthase
MQKIFTPNRVTLVRVLIALAAVALYTAAPRGDTFRFGILGVSLTFLAVILDGLDGFLARRFHLESPIGAQLDILGDRVLENLFFTFFAVSGEISLWVPLFFFARGSLTDFLRGIAATRNSSAHQAASELRRNWFFKSKWGRTLVASRASRLAYGAVKCACFCALGIEWTLIHVTGIASSSAIQLAGAATTALVAATIAFCFLRALPVLWEGRRDVLRLSHPSENATHILKPNAQLHALRRTAQQTAAR